MNHLSLADLADPIPTDIDEATARVSERAVAALRGARILVTGGTGFLGSWLVDVLLALNHRYRLDLVIYLLTRQEFAFKQKRPDLAVAPQIQLLSGDVRNFKCPDIRLTHVVHAAADTSATAAAQPLALAETILDGSRHVFNIARRAGAQRFLFLSSGAVVGRVFDSAALITEDATTAPSVEDPASFYGNAKRFAEHLLLLAAAKTRVELVIARGFAFVGPRMPLTGHFAIGNFIHDAVLGYAPRVNSAGIALRSYLYAADAAVWLITLLALAQPRRIYNVGSDQALTIQALALQVAKTLQAPLPALPVFDNRNIDQQHNYVPNISRASTELALEPWTTLPTAISHTALWARNMARP